MSNILLLQESCLENIANHAITPTAGGVSYISSFFNLDSICDPYAYTVYDDWKKIMGKLLQFTVQLLKPEEIKAFMCLSMAFLQT